MSQTNISTDSALSITEKAPTANISTSNEECQIIRGKIPSITIYEISENELKEITDGSSASIWFNLLMLFIGIFVPTIPNFWLIDYKLSQQAWIINALVCIIMFVAGVVMLILWRKDRGNLSALIKSIKDRANPRT